MIKAKGVVVISPASMTEPGQAPREASWSRPMRTVGRFLKAGGPIVPVLALFLILYVTYGLLAPRAFTVGGLSILSQESATVAIAALGVAIVAIAGGFDLSFASVISLVNVVVVTVAGNNSDAGVFVWIAGLGVGLLAGLVNGALVVGLRIPSIVATLAMLFVWGGVAVLIMDKPGGVVPPAVGVLSSGSFLGLPAPIWVVICAFLLWWILKHTPDGRGWYAVGGNSRAAEAAGVPTRRVTVSAYAVAGLLYGAAGLYMSAQTGSGDPTIGSSLLLTVFTAVVIGGTVFGGGVGTGAGAVLGALILSLIANVLYVLGVSSFYTDVFNGVVLLAAIAVIGGRKLRGTRGP